MTVLCAGQIASAVNCPAVEQIASPVTGITIGSENGRYRFSRSSRSHFHLTWPSQFFRWGPVANSGGSRGGHGAMAPPLSIVGALSAPEGTLRVSEGMICKLQQVFWCPLKGFTDLLRDPLSSYLRGPSEHLKRPSEQPEGAFWAHSGPSERLKPQCLWSSNLEGPSQLEGPGGPLWHVGPSLGQILDLSLSKTDHDFLLAAKEDFFALKSNLLCSKFTESYYCMKRINF